jgi:DNA repair protein RecO (recombination protein O)
MPALVVHVRPYRESSAMVQFFTRSEGRFVGVMRGVQRRRNPVSVQPFCYGSLSCYGRGNLMTVTQFEQTGRYTLQGDALSAGFYVLELITRCLGERQSEPTVFDATLTVLSQLEAEQALAPVLRLFELQLLNALGYGVDFRHAATTGSAILEDKCYSYVPELGFVETQEQESSYPGHVLLAIAAHQLNGAAVLRAAKAINQSALAPLIGSAPLVSRSLYIGTHRG